MDKELVEAIDRRGRRFSAPLEVRAVNADGSIPFVGHAAVFNVRADIYGMFEEQFAPGAFAKTLQEADVRALINHDANLVLARSKANTLRLAEDARGLLVEADMAPTTYAQDLALLMQRGDVNQMSFLFRAVKETWDESGAIPLRTVTEARLFDVSVVTFPIYEETDAALRSLLVAARSAKRPAERSVARIDDPAVREAIESLTSAATSLRSLLDVGAGDERAQPGEPTAAKATEPDSHSEDDKERRERRLKLAASRWGLAS